MAQSINVLLGGDKAHITLEHANEIYKFMFY